MEHLWVMEAARGGIPPRGVSRDCPFQNYPCLGGGCTDGAPPRGGSSFDGIPPRGISRDCLIDIIIF